MKTILALDIGTKLGGNVEFSKVDHGNLMGLRVRGLLNTWVDYDRPRRVGSGLMEERRAPGAPAVPGAFPSLGVKREGRSVRLPGVVG